MYKVAWSRVKRHQSPRVLWASCKQEPMESMALVPPTLLGLAYVGVFLIKSQYIKQNQSTNLFTAWGQTSVGEAFLHGKHIHILWKTESEYEIPALRKHRLLHTQNAIPDTQWHKYGLFGFKLCCILIEMRTREQTAGDTRNDNNAKIHFAHKSIQMIEKENSAQASWPNTDEPLMCGHPSLHVKHVTLCISKTWLLLACDKRNHTHKQHTDNSRFSCCTTVHMHNARFSSSHGSKCTLMQFARTQQQF